MHKLFALGVAGTTTLLTSVAALAGEIPTLPGLPTVPEPSTIALFAGGIGAAVVIRKLRKRK